MNDVLWKESSAHWTLLNAISMLNGYSYSVMFAMLATIWRAVCQSRLDFIAIVGVDTPAFA